MTIEKVILDPQNPEITLTCYIPFDSPENRTPLRKAMLVLPGGGYWGCSDREGEPIALAYLGYGYVSFVLGYSIQEKARHPKPLIDASLAMKYIRLNASRFHIDPEKIFAIGFSAGGHLCGMLGTAWKNEEVNNAIDIPYGWNRPAGVVLSYACLSYNAGPTDLYNYQLRTNNPTDEMKRSVSPADLVDQDSSPAFIWHTSDDNVVPVKNAIDMAAKLAEAGKKFELHIYPEGAHGISLADKRTEAGWGGCFINPHIAQWFSDSLKWMDTL